jgi:hypothetical protein
VFLIRRKEETDSETHRERADIENRVDAGMITP